MKTFKTPKGTELPFLDLKGKDYLQVMHRIFWFREEHPDWQIKTRPWQCGMEYAVIRAYILDNNGKCLATAMGSESAKDFKDHIEKAETKAIGRALALCGYGTQFAVELDEGERLADSPTPVRRATKEHKSSNEFIIQIGTKFKGKNMYDCQPEEIHSFVNWLKESAQKKGEPLKGHAIDLVNSADSWFEEVKKERAAK